MNFKYIHQTLSLILAVSCTSMHEMEGYVTFAIDENVAEPLEVSVESKSAAVTKAVTQDYLDSFIIAVEGTDVTGLYGDIKGQSTKLPVGTYTATARSNEDDDQVKTLNGGYGAPCYAGSTQFEVKPLEKNTTAVIRCKVSNARVCLALSDAFKSYYDESRTSVSICESESFASRELPMLPSSDLKEAYYTAGDPVYVRLTTSKSGANTAVTYVFRAIEAVAACTTYNVSLSVDSNTTTGGITFAVSGSDMTTNDLLSVENYKAPSAPPVEDI